MREILFRGKKLDNGEWVEGAYFPKNDNYPATIYTDDGLGTSVDPATVGQYTETRDCRGNRIFEGDVAIFEWDSGYRTFFIEYKDGAFLATPTHPADDIWRIRISGCTNRFEIIGNIHDNPELLEQEG